ncbi:MAG: hypothetical protein IAF08_10365 [Rhizobacter sp.]|nr:hypothetical protein [Chlorobiales bacterium]
MKKACILFFLALFLVTALASPVAAQQEDYPANLRQVSDIYVFLKHLRQRGVLRNFNDLILPLSRREIASLLIAADSSATLTATERDILFDYKTEFRYDLSQQGYAVASQPPPRTLLPDFFSGEPLADKLSETFSPNREKFFYQWADSAAGSLPSTFFADLLLSTDFRSESAPLQASAGWFELGGNIRGTLKGRVGYSLRATNGVLRGSKEVAFGDNRLKQNFRLNLSDIEPTFDFTEAVIKVDADVLNVEIARQTLLIGTGESSRIILSDNAPPLDFIRLWTDIGRFRYTFIHASLLGPYTFVVDSLSGGVREYTPKFFVLHRFDFFIGDMSDPWLRLGLTETVVYGNRGAELTYLNPLIFLKSAEHSLWDRDNSALTFDAKVFLFRNVELYTTLFIDDIQLGSLGTTSSRSKFVFNLGGNVSLPQLDLTLEYTCIDPYAYTHRLPYNTYTNSGFGLGHFLPPNSDEFFFRARWFALRRLTLTAEVSRTRHGDNVIDPATGAVLKNVGGDFNLGFDASGQKEFLDGVLTETLAARLNARYEPFKNILLVAAYELRRIATGDVSSLTNFLSLGVRIDY